MGSKLDNPPSTKDALVKLLKVRISWNVRFFRTLLEFNFDEFWISRLAAVSYFSYFSVWLLREFMKEKKKKKGILEVSVLRFFAFVFSILPFLLFPLFFFQNLTGRLNYAAPASNLSSWIRVWSWPRTCFCSLGAKKSVIFKIFEFLIQSCLGSQTLFFSELVCLEGFLNFVKLIEAWGRFIEQEL